MELIAVIAFVLFLWWLFKRSTDKPEPKNLSRGSKAERVFNENRVWLENRWQSIEENTDLVSSWYFDAPTERQIERLQDQGLQLTKNKLTKGQVSDLIGLFEKPEEDELEILKFFKHNTKGYTQTRARHEILALFLKQENKEKWENRPADVLEKEFYRFIGQKVPTGLTKPQAIQFQSEAEISEELENE
jgi:hypothetical protein